LKKEQIENKEKFDIINSQIQNLKKEKDQILEELALLQKTLSKLKHDYNILNEDKVNLSEKLNEALEENKLLSQRVAKLEENERKFIIRLEEFQQNKSLPPETNISLEEEGILNQALKSKIWSLFDEARIEKS